MCLVAFQKMFQKIFFDVWLCSWKYHRKHIFYLLLIFSQLPNEYVVSFIPKNTNKTKKRSHFLGEIAIVIGEITIAISLISIASDAAREICKIAIAISPISIARLQSARSRSTPIGTVPVITIAIVVRRCGSFRLARCVGQSSQALREAVRVWERSACERQEENVWSENTGWNWFSLLLA